MHPVLFHIGWLLVPSYGAVTSLGVLAALMLAQFAARHCGVSRTATGTAVGTVGFDARHAWNMVVLAVFAGLAVSRLLLIAVNLGDLRAHPAWLLAVAMVHHPLLAAAGATGAALAVAIYARWARLPLRAVADCLAAPVAVGYAFEQAGALMAGSDYGGFSSAKWAVTYTSTLAARWSGTPLDVPLYPVQAYAAVGALLVAGLCLIWFRMPRESGDIGGVCLVGMGALFFLTEIFRDWEGRGVLFGGIVNTPQLVGLGLVLLGGVLLIHWRGSKAAVTHENVGIDG